MEPLSNRALISRLYSSANHVIEEANYDSASWKAWYQTVQGLTDPEKMVYVIVKMNQTVTHGGFTEFYETGFGVFAPEIIHVLNAIKATASANIVESSLPIVNPKGLLDDDYKGYVFNIELNPKQKAALYACDIKYDQLHGIENLEDLLGNYLQHIIG
ncbi:MAG: DUF4375 domain-containing protein [Bacteroidia bacterium]